MDTTSYTRQQSITIPAANSRNGAQHHIPAITKLVSKIKAYFIVRGVKSALKEVELIEKGLKKPKSLDELLNEL